tara:strand:- start:164 stop:511 length:348 start_codon:yes stop_codon:yes gene_type:complete
MSLAVSKISVGDILLASLYTEAKAKYIVISKCHIDQMNRPLSSETMREKIKTVYSLHVLWRREGEGDHGSVCDRIHRKAMRNSHSHGCTVTMSHRAMKAHYWTFDLDYRPEEINK